MKLFGKELHWSERQQIVTILLAAVIVVVVLIVLVLTPLAKRRTQLERSIKQARSELASRNYLTGLGPLKNRKAREESRFYELKDQWKEVSERLAVFPDQKALAHSEVGKIDFKVALYDVRDRLRKKARSAGIDLPWELGIDEDVYSADDARTLVLQLRAVERLVDMMMALDIRQIRHIEPLRPVQYVLTDNQADYMEDYPVQVVFRGSIKNLEDLTEASLGRDHVFVVRHMRVQKVSPEDPDLLEVQAVMSALLFYKDIDDMVPPSLKRKGRMPPLGA